MPRVTLDWKGRELEADVEYDEDGAIRSVKMTLSNDLMSEIVVNAVAIGFDFEAPFWHGLQWMVEPASPGRRGAVFAELELSRVANVVRFERPAKKGR